VLRIQREKMSLSPLASLLIRIQGKIESRTRRPWFDLQRSYFYSDANGVKSVAELRKALEHFHVLLSDPEYDLLYSGFPKGNGGFDFKQFAAQLYPKESTNHIIRDGRYLDDAPQYTQPSVAYQSQGYPHVHSANCNCSYPAVAVPQQLAQQVLYASPLQSTGAAIMTSDIDVPRLGETLNSNGTTSYYTMPKKTQKAGFQTSTGVNKSKRVTKNNPNFVPRITYNRAPHQRFNESGYEDYYSGNPVPQGYPSEEFKDHGRYSTSLEKPRFERKNPQEWVEVARRTNISRQYNRATGTQSQ